jgi:hypothetical protein
MKTRAFVKAVLTLVVCCLAFAIAYVGVRSVSGEQNGGTAMAVASPQPDSTVPPDATMPDATPTASVTMATSILNLGEFVPSGGTYDKFGIQITLPSGIGDFRVIYPVITDGPGVADWGNPIMTIYSIQTDSSVFLAPETRDGVTRLVEKGRYAGQPGADAALDQISTSAEVSAR